MDPIDNLVSEAHGLCLAVADPLHSESARIRLSSVVGEMLRQRLIDRRFGVLVDLKIPVDQTLVARYRELAEMCESFTDAHPAFADALLADACEPKYIPPLPVYRAAGVRFSVVEGGRV